MPRLGRRGRARKRNLKLAEQRKEEIHRPISETTKLQGRQFTYAVIVHGIGYRAAADVAFIAQVPAGVVRHIKNTK